MSEKMEKPIVIEGREVRNYVVSDIRAASGDDGVKKISGYAAVFNQPSEDLGGFVEKISPGAFAQTLATDDIRSLWNHNADYPLGRVKARTLSLSEDLKGLKFEIIPPDTQYARDLITSIERGDVDSMSFGFRTMNDNWERVGDTIVRTLLEVQLFEVSPVTFPAYPQTSAAVRSKLDEFTQSNQVVAKEAEARLAQVRRESRKRKLQIKTLIGN
jgi:HK97 family phage prohead protease